MKIAALILALVAALPLVGQRNVERGFPLMEIVPQKEQLSGGQLFSIAQRNDGVLFFGGLSGVLSYDGAWWRAVELPNQSAAFAVASGKGPEIAAGGVGELGWVGPDANGTLRYHSLLPQLPPAQRQIGEVRSICATGSGFLYAAEHALIEWNGGAPRVVTTLTSATMPQCFRAHGTTYVALDRGLHRLEGARLLPAGFGGKRIDVVIEATDGRSVVAVRNEGLFLADGTPFASEASAWLRETIVVAAARLRDGRMAVGTRQHGALLLDRNGRIEQTLDAASDLPREVLAGLLEDREGALWFAHHGPIARLDLATPLSVVDERSGIEGSPRNVAEHRGRLFVATSHAFFAAAGHTFRRIDGVPAPVWDALSVDDALMIFTHEGVLLLHDDGTLAPIAGTSALTSYSAIRLQSDPTRVYVATRKGVGILARDGNSWRFDGMLPGVSPYVTSLLEENGLLWTGTVFDGAMRIDPRTGRAQKFGSGEITLARIDGRVVLAGVGSAHVVAPDGKLVPAPIPATIRGNYFRLLQDARGNVWANTTPPLLVPKRSDGTYARDAMPLVSIGGERPQAMRAIGDSVWLAGGNALYRYDLSSARNRLAQPRPLIGRVTTSDGKPVTAPLPHAFGRMHLEFGPASYRPGVAYQYRLAPSDSEWSAWTSEAAIDYTNLTPGAYTFSVRSRSASGDLSEPASWSFTVLPPWYRTRPAVAAWVVLAMLLVALIVRQRTRALQRQAVRLRELVEERTDELRQANAHLERLSLLDDLTGIANRRYFQRALLEDWSMAHAQQEPLALILLDLDHFKQLNDRFGHPAGDAALAQVGRYLARQIRRSGDLSTRTADLVARIGGEEFAVLLTNTTEAEARSIAEMLRSGTEQLGAGVTASCGVAAIVPHESEGWSALMSEADRALYAAKDGGRNQVRAASELGPESVEHLQA